MSKLYIREWAGISGDKQAPAGLITDQVVDYSGGVAVSAAFNERTTLVEWTTDAICSWVIREVGTSTNATTSNLRYAANDRGFVNVVAGQKISAITNT